MNKKTSTILVVDDDKSIRTTLAAILEEEGYEVDTAETGAEAIKKSSDRFFDLALIDIRLPDMYGTELLNAMKETTPKMAKIIVTGYPSLQNAITALNEGADGYILKPVNGEDLLESIRKHLQRRAEANRYSEEKVSEFIETRAREFSQRKLATNSSQ